MSLLIVVRLSWLSPVYTLQYKSATKQHISLTLLTHYFMMLLLFVWRWRKIKAQFGNKSTYEDWHDL